MSELINKYNEQKEIFLETLFWFHNANVLFLEKQNPTRSHDLRKCLKKMRTAIRNMEKLAMERRKERSIEWREAHPKCKGNNNE